MVQNMCRENVLNSLLFDFCVLQAKEMVGSHVFNEDPHLPASQKTIMIASAIAGFTASFFSLPFDLMKSRLRKLTVTKRH